MKHVVIGTAGHIDHGKTLLTLALTGTNTDRLAEEQRRGVTIEPGFAKLTLPSGQTVGIVDVPGHERFIKNMLAGASGIDAALLVVAADEGFMPQTQEHLDILSLLGIHSGLVVLTKTDLVDKDRLAAVTQDTLKRVRCTFLEDAPVVPVSAVTGDGVTSLMGAIERLVERMPAHAADRPFRLPIDRVFTRPGYGVIVTGTLTDGTVSAGQSGMLYPQGTEVRMRGLQNHGNSADTLDAGMRAAVNIAGVEKQDISRGSVLAMPDSMLCTNAVAAYITLLPGAAYGVHNAAQLHFYHGTQELLAKVRLLDTDELHPGESGYAQLFFSEPLVARGLDRFILRFYSPMTTIGGGVILDMEAEKRMKRNDPPTLARLAACNASPESRLLQIIEDAGYFALPGSHPRTFARTGLSETETEAAYAALLASGKLVRLDQTTLAASALDRAWENVHAILEKHHADDPYSIGMRVAELREKLPPMPRRTADALLRRFCEAGKLIRTGTNVALCDRLPGATRELALLDRKLSALYESFGFTPPKNDEVAALLGEAPDVFRAHLFTLCSDGILVRLTTDTTVHASCYEEAKARFIGMFAKQETVTLAAFRTALGITRKYAHMYLDRFDRERISRLVGDARVLLPRPMA